MAVFPNPLFTFSPGCKAGPPGCKAGVIGVEMVVGTNHQIGVVSTWEKLFQDSIFFFMQRIELSWWFFLYLMDHVSKNEGSLLEDGLWVLREDSLVGRVLRKPSKAVLEVTRCESTSLSCLVWSFALHFALRSTYFGLDIIDRLWGNWGQFRPMSRTSILSGQQEQTT